MSDNMTVENVTGSSSLDSMLMPLRDLALLKPPVKGTLDFFQKPLNDILQSNLMDISVTAGKNVLTDILSAAPFREAIAIASESTADIVASVGNQISSTGALATENTLLDSNAALEKVSTEAGPQPNNVFQNRPFENSSSELPPFQNSSSLRNALLTDSREFSIDFNGFTPEAQIAFQYAVDLWDSHLDLKVPVKINANFTDLGGFNGGNIPLGFGGTNGGVKLSGGGLPGTLLGSVAQSNEIIGSDFNGDQAEINITFNSNADANFFFSPTFEFGSGSQNKIGPKQFDFIQLALHELGHGLGVLSTFNVDESGVGSFSNSAEAPPLLYDLFVENEAGTPLVLLDNNSTVLGDELLGGGLVFDGSNLDLANLSVGGGNANTENNGTPPKLFAPDNFAQGTSIIHLDEATFAAGTPNSIITPSANQGESVQDIGPVVLGMVDDLGFTLASDAEQNTFERLAGIEAKSSLRGLARADQRPLV